MRAQFTQFKRRGNLQLKNHYRLLKRRPPAESPASWETLNWPAMDLGDHDRYEEDLFRFGDSLA
jgi:hypothetical protein